MSQIPHTIELLGLPEQATHPSLCRCPECRSFSRMPSRTSQLLLTHLVNLKPLHESKVCKLPTCSMAFCSAGGTSNNHPHKVSFNCVNNVRREAVTITFCCLAECEICTSRWWNGSKLVNNHLIFLWFMRHIAILPPKKMEKGTVRIWNSHLVEHGFYVRHNSHSLFTKSQEDPYKWTGQVCALLKHVIERLSHKLGQTDKLDANFSWLARVINSIVQYVPGCALRKALLIMGHCVHVLWRGCLPWRPYNLGTTLGLFPAFSSTKWHAARPEPCWWVEVLGNP